MATYTLTVEAAPRNEDLQSPSVLRGSGVYGLWHARRLSPRVSTILYEESVDVTPLVQEQYGGRFTHQSGLTGHEIARQYGPAVLPSCRTAKPGNGSAPWHR